MSCMICGPHREATGLLKLNEGENGRLSTMLDLEGSIDVFTPERCEEGCSDKVVFNKKTYKASEIASVTITMVAGDVTQMDVVAYEMGASSPVSSLVYSGAATGSLSIRPFEKEWLEEAIAGKNPKVEIIDE